MVDSDISLHSARSAGPLLALPDEILVLVTQKVGVRGKSILERSCRRLHRLYKSTRASHGHVCSLSFLPLYGKADLTNGLDWTQTAYGGLKIDLQPQLHVLAAARSQKDMIKTLQPMVRCTALLPPCGPGPDRPAVLHTV